MEKRILLFAILIFSAPVFAFAQTKTITNADLEAFRNKRLAAEKDLRENYAKLGFPSPQELEKQIEKSRLEREELAQRLREERVAEQQYEIDLLRTQNSYFRSQDKQYVRRERNYFYGVPPFYYYNPRFFGFPVKTRRNNRNRGNVLTIRPPKPIRPPRTRFK
jgi:hypothetical protein